MKRMIILSFFLFLVIGCQSKENNIIIKEVSSGLITLQVKVEKVEVSKVQVHTELVYTGDNSIEIIHTDPLVVTVLGDRSNRPEFVVSSVGIEKILDKNEVYSYDKDKLINILPEDKVLYTQTVLTIDGEQKIIDLDIDLDEF
ncbi:hypothetical protein [Cohnella boryungensis]|uniref:DUF3221 domain-containing protein n=1 Tax=Cohnella boryungensis TaxID=768479 RepID=A0ABV8SEV2_9BACL